MKKDRLLEKQ
jgi:hypothetical protein